MNACSIADEAAAAVAVRVFAETGPRRSPVGVLVRLFGSFRSWSLAPPFSMSNPAFTQVSQQNRELVDPYAVLQRRRNVRAAQGALRWLFLSHDQRAPAIPVEEQAVNVPSYVQGRTKRDSRPSSQALAADIVADFARVLREFADEQLIDTAWKREGGNLVDELYHHHRGLENVFASNRPYAVVSGALDSRWLRLKLTPLPLAAFKGQQ